MSRKSAKERWRAAFGIARVTVESFYSQPKIDPKYIPDAEYAVNAYDSLANRKPGRTLEKLRRENKAIASGCSRGGFMPLPPLKSYNYRCASVAVTPSDSL